MKKSQQIINNLRNWYNQLLEYMEKQIPKEDWKSIMDEYISNATKRTFSSKIGINLNRSRVLDYLYHAHLSSRGFKKVHLLWYFSFLKLYNPVDDLHSQWKCSYNTYMGKVKEIINIFDKNLNFVFFELCLMDNFYYMNNEVIIGSIDSTDIESEKVMDKQVKETMEISKKYSKKKFPRHPMFTGKNKIHGYKYQITSTSFIGLIFEWLGAFDSPFGDQPIARLSKINEKLERLSQFMELNLFILGDGHYTNFKKIRSRKDYGTYEERRQYHSKRAKIENINQQLKVFNIFCTKFRMKRGKYEEKKILHSKIVNNVLQILNLKKLLYLDEYKYKK